MKNKPIPWQCGARRELSYVCDIRGDQCDGLHHLGACAFSHASLRATTDKRANHQRHRVQGRKQSVLYVFQTEHKHHIVYASQADTHFGRSCIHAGTCVGIVSFTQSLIDLPTFFFSRSGLSLFKHSIGDLSLIHI